MAQIAIGVVLAGGQSRRMGTDKAIMTVGGQTLLERVVRALREVADTVVAVGPARGRPLVPNLRWVDDAYPGTGPLGGIATALELRASPRILVVACDMPFLDSVALRCVVSHSVGWDVTVPLVEGRFQPLHAVYAASALPTIRRRIGRGQLRIADCFPDLRVRKLSDSELVEAGADLHSFWSVNSADDLRQAEASLSEEAAAGAAPTTAQSRGRGREPLDPHPHTHS